MVRHAHQPWFDMLTNRGSTCSPTVVRLCSPTMVRLCSPTVVRLCSPTVVRLCHKIGLDIRGRCGGVPRRGGSGRHDKAEKMAEVACCKKLHFVLVQTLKLVQGDGRSFRKLATSGICGATRGCSEGETSPPLYFLGAVSSRLSPPLA